MFPLRNPAAFKMFEAHLAVFWHVGEFTKYLDQDQLDWAHKLSAGERQMLAVALAFFAASDGIVSENLASRFRAESDVAEVIAFYDTQACFEQIHSHSYSILIDRLIPGHAEKTRLFDAVTNFACVRRKAEWARKWITCPDASFAKRLVAFACIEGIFFSSSFASIYWFKSRGLMPGLSLANEWISRDEGLHTDFAVLMHSQLPEHQQLAHDDMRALVADAVEAEMQFVHESMPETCMAGMNARLMEQHVHAVADRLLAQLGCAALFRNAVTPFAFMLHQSTQTKTNFFEANVSNYSAAVDDSTPESYATAFLAADAGGDAGGDDDAPDV